MKRASRMLFVVATCVWLGLPLSQAMADQLRSAEIPSNSGIPRLPPIAGIPYHEAQLILERHREELMQLPGVEGVGFMAEGLVVTTTNPAALPAAVEGLPIFSVLPSRLREPHSQVQTPQLLHSQPPPSPTSPQGGESSEPSELPVRPCAPGYTRDPATGQCSGGPPAFEPPTGGEAVFLPDPVPNTSAPTRQQPSQFRLAIPGQPVAGIPYEEALEIYKRHFEDLYRLSGRGVSFTADGLLVETENPEKFPEAVDGLPVIPIPPTELSVESQAGSLSSSPATAQSSPPHATPQKSTKPAPEACLPGATFDTIAGRCRLNDPPPDPPEVQLLPPPPGVIILKPGKIREQADSCPQGFKEVEGDNNWRFCVDPDKPEPIPPLWAPPIAGIPYEQALEIHSRHVEELSKLPGVQGVGLGADGIHVTTDQPDEIPAEVEGLPIKIDPPSGTIPMFLGHTFNTEVRPLHGAVAGGDITILRGTFTGVSVSMGKLWVIFPSHLLNNCNATSPCPPNSTTSLNQCPHYVTSNQRLIAQPLAGSFPQVGYAQRWTPLSGVSATSDVAAAFMDSDLNEGNGSLSADRQVEFNEVTAIPFLGTSAPPPTLGTSVKMLSSIGPPHDLQLRVDRVNQTRMGVRSCAGQPVNIINQTFYTMLGGYAFQSGDSGSPVLDNSDRIIGMVNFCETVIDPVTGQSICTAAGGGTNAQAIQSELDFDAWYGTAVNDNTFGVYRPSTRTWYLDGGNGKWDGNAVDGDILATSFGATGDKPVTGNWNGSDQLPRNRKIGTFRPSTGMWYLDKDGDHFWDGSAADIVAGPLGASTDLPVAGDWNGNGTTEIGTFRPSTGQWFLDSNGNNRWDGCGVDRCGGPFGTNDRPVVGDWDGDGSADIGTYRPSTAQWFLDNGNEGWNGCGSFPAKDLCLGPFGTPNDLPIGGNWTGFQEAGGLRLKDKIGVFAPLGHSADPRPLFVLDNGNGQFVSVQEEQYLVGPFGQNGDLPVRWTISIVKGN